LTESVAPAAPVQRSTSGLPFLQLKPDGGGPADGDVHAAAARGTATPATALPHGDTIQRAFGKHDISGIKAHQGGEAAASAGAMGAQAYASGDHVVLGGGTDLHTVAHEAAHVVQQRGGVQLKGGVGATGDTYEQHADAVADAVVQGKSAEGLLDQHAGGGAAKGGGGAGPVQRKWSQTEAKVQDSHHGGVKSQYTAGTNVVELHIDAGANEAGSMMQDFLLALWEARDAMTLGQARGVNGHLFMRPGGAQVLKMTMEMLGEALGNADGKAAAQELKGDRQKNKAPMTADNDTLDKTILPEHKAYRDSLVGAPGVTMAPIGGGTSGGTVNMLAASDDGAAERRLYDEAVFGLKPMMGLSVTVELAQLNSIIGMMEGKMKLFQKLALKAKYAAKG
jgi:hypothetical protein